MKKITVKDYADSKGIGVQAVYKRIRVGALKSEKHGRSVYVLLDEGSETSSESDKAKQNPNKATESGNFNEVLGVFREQLKAKDVHIEQLMKQLDVKDSQISELNIRVGQLIALQN
ncbi:MAG: hypothetical protein HQK84_12885, partial [Nitrospinae bacterium]|nr:hypothetical protein [Nitrospinota bacterium]